MTVRSQMRSSLNAKHRSVGRSLSAVLRIVGVALALTLPNLGDNRSQVRAQTDTAVAVSPTAATIQGCTEIDVTVAVNDVSDLYAADVQLAFDPDALEVVDADPATNGVQVTLLSDLLHPDWVLRNTADNDAGTIWYALTQMNPREAANGSGPLFSIRFRAKQAGTFDLEITYTKLSDRDGNTIATTTSDGTITTVAPPAPSLQIARANATTARLSWASVSGVDAYHLYRDTEAYFEPGTTPYANQSSVTYDDVGALGNVDTNYFYLARSACANGFESDDSARVGEFDYALIQDAYNAVAIPLMDTTLEYASDLGAETGSITVSRWRGDTQSLEIYIVGLGGHNFQLATGHGYFIDTPTAGPEIFTTVGAVPNEGSVKFSITRGSPWQMNLISLPLDQPTLTQADTLAASIGGVPVISKWNPTTTSFISRMVSLGGLNFDTLVGYPYWPCADTSSSIDVWP